MLSKNQARLFFLGGTIVTFAIFLALSWTTLSKEVPKNTHSENISPEVVRGKEIWESNNCMGCHTIMGEGAYYAPELTKVYERRGEAFIRSMLKDPQAMYPNDRKMTNYKLSDDEIDSLVAFLKWIGGMDLNGFPPKPDILPPTQQTQSAYNMTPKVFQQTCYACHSVAGVGGNVGPKLDGIGSLRDSEFLTAWLRDPLKIKADSKMPKLPLTEAEISELVTYLSGLKGESK